MSKLEQKLEEDRQLRDTARNLLLNELERAKHDLTPGAIGQRMASRITGKISDAGDAAEGFAKRHSGKALAAAALAAGAAGLWLGRRQIGSALTSLKEKGRELYKEGVNRAKNKDIL